MSFVLKALDVGDDDRDKYNDDDHGGNTDKTAMKTTVMLEMLMETSNLFIRTIWMRDSNSMQHMQGDCGSFIQNGCLHVEW